MNNNNNNLSNLSKSFKYNPQDFIELKKLGKGSFGETWKVRSKEDGKTYVIKKINKKDTDKAAFESETNALNKVEPRCKSHLLCYYGMYDDPNSDYYAIITEDLSDYTPLDEYIRNSGNNNENENKGTPKAIGVNVGILENINILDQDKLSRIRTIFSNLIIAIKTLHDAQIAHRDIKPANLLVNKLTSDIKLIDFGLACFARECEKAILGGSLIYIAPELIKLFGPANANVNFDDNNDSSSSSFSRGQRPSPPLSFPWYVKTDYYALGISMLEYFVGVENILKIYNKKLTVNQILNTLRQLYGPEYDDIFNAIADLTNSNPRNRHLPILTFKTSFNNQNQNQNYTIPPTPFRHERPEIRNLNLNQHPNLQRQQQYQSSYPNSNSTLLELSNNNHNNNNQIPFTPTNSISIDDDPRLMSIDIDQQNQTLPSPLLHHQNFQLQQNQPFWHENMYRSQFQYDIGNPFEFEETMLDNYRRNNNNNNNYGSNQFYLQNRMYFPYQ
jgi:serine/threonine protein kinase